jgi:uncharacterized membrane protein YdjX (TVP38/TMEM64 family)
MDGAWRPTPGPVRRAAFAASLRPGRPLYDGSRQNASMTRYWRLWLVLLFLVALWAVFRVSGAESHFNVLFLHERFEQHKLAGLLIFIFLFALGNLIQIPGWLFLVSAVLALGRFWGGLATYLAACVTCISTFWVIRLIGANALREVKGRLTGRIFAHLDAHPVRSVVLLRLLFQTVPALNYALALSGIRFRSYLLGTLLGLPLPILLYTLFFGLLAEWLRWPVPQGI